MTDNEIINLISSVLKKLWPKWDLNTEQLRPWRTVLRPIDYYAAQKAAEEHFISPEGGYGRPKLNAIVELAKKYQPKKAVEAKSNDYVPSVFVQCIEHKNLIRLYQFFAIHVTGYKQNDAEYILAAAECTRKRVEALYSGYWITVQQTSFERLHLQLIEYRCSSVFKEYMKKLAEERKPKRYELVSG